MTYGLINPGAGQYAGSNQKRQAERHVRRLIRDADIDATFTLDREKPDEDGYYWFTVRCGKRSVPVCMPGCPAEAFEWKSSTPWPFPQRCYIDGNSWMWEFAIGVLRCGLRACGPCTDCR